MITGRVAILPDALWRRVASIAVVIGMSLRYVLAITTVGANDATYWEPIAKSIVKIGIIQTYFDYGNFRNHPPLMGVVWSMIFRTTNALDLKFLPVMKSLYASADFVTAIILWRLLTYEGQNHRTAALGIYFVRIGSPGNRVTYPAEFDGKA